MLFVNGMGGFDGAGCGLALPWRRRMKSLTWSLFFRTFFWSSGLGGALRGDMHTGHTLARGAGRSLAVCIPRATTKAVLPSSMPSTTRINACLAIT
jgi:hypothetical protein